MIVVERLFDILPYHAAHYNPKPDVLASKEVGKWTMYSIAQYRHMADAVSYALLEYGVKMGDKVATIMPGRPEWNIIDIGILQTGAIHVPIYPTIKESDYRYILEHAEVKFLFIPGMEIFRKIEHILPELKEIIAVASIKQLQSSITLNDVISKGEKAMDAEKELHAGHQSKHAVHDPDAEPFRRIDQIKQTIRTHDLATIIYTSGTTGNPKGVMLTHHNIISNFMAVKHIPPIGQEGRALSYLPLCHIYERMLNYLFQYLGISVYYAENLAVIAENIREVKPSIVTTVPRLLEKIYDKLMQTGGKLKGVKKFFFFRAVYIANHYKEDGANSIGYKLEKKLLDKLVYSKWREALGNNLKVVVSGGAALQPRLARIFNAAGIPVVEGYGLTETSPVIAVNDLSPGGNKFGTVGRPLKNTLIKIAEDGEILAKGPGVMLGYYREPDQTREAIDADGWFHTGDLGELLPEGHLKITGRKKEIFKTSLGKYISPEVIENKFKESRFIDALIVLGENQKFAAALIVPDFNFLTSYCAKKGIPFTSNKEIISDPVIKKRIDAEVKKYNHYFGATEQIKRYQLMGEEFTIEGGELTASLKLRRQFIMKKYAEIIAGLFA